MPTAGSMLIIEPIGDIQFQDVCYNNIKNQSSSYEKSITISNPLNTSVSFTLKSVITSSLSSLSSSSFDKSSDDSDNYKTNFDSNEIIQQQQQQQQQHSYCITPSNNITLKSNEKVNIIISLRLPPTAMNNVPINNTLSSSSLLSSSQVHLFRDILSIQSDYFEQKVPLVFSINMSSSSLTTTTTTTGSTPTATAIIDDDMITNNNNNNNNNENVLNIENVDKYDIDNDNDNDDEIQSHLLNHDSTSITGMKHNNNNNSKQNK